MPNIRCPTIAAIGPARFEGTDDFVRRADRAMYHAKAASRDSPGHQIRIDVERLPDRDADAPPPADGATEFGTVYQLG